MVSLTFGNYRSCPGARRPRDRLQWRAALTFKPACADAMGRLSNARVQSRPASNRTVWRRLASSASARISWRSNYNRESPPSCPRGAPPTVFLAFSPGKKVDRDRRTEGPKARGRPVGGQHADKHECYGELYPEIHGFPPAARIVRTKPLSAKYLQANINWNFESLRLNVGLAEAKYLGRLAFSPPL